MREAGALALTTFRATAQALDQGQRSPVSEADIAVDDLLRERLTRLRAGLSAGCRRKPRTIRARLDARAVWIVDPIDGTRAYLAGRTDWAISVALVEDGRPVLAALYCAGDG